MPTVPQVVPSVDSLLDAETLRTILGVSASLHVEALDTLGYSRSQFFRVTVEDTPPEQPSFIVKRTVLAEDWFFNRSRDHIG